MFCCSSSFAAYLLQYVGRFVFEVKYMFFFFFYPKLNLASVGYMIKIGSDTS